jgi:Family of unknown function (DUF6301)
VNCRQRITSAVAPILAMCLIFMEPLQVVAAEPGGWSRARFGMTPEQVLAAFSGEAVRVPTPDTYGKKDELVAPIAILDTKVGPIEHARVNFVFPAKSERPTLQRVAIGTSAVPPKPGDDTRMRSEYDQLVRALTEKYGPPSTQAQDGTSRSDTLKQEVTWVQPNVVVELSYFRSAMFGKEIGCILSLSYRPPMSAAERDRL